MVETGNDLAQMIKFMDFVNKCIKTNSIMNDDDDDGVSDCDAYYITACCTENQSSSYTKPRCFGNTCTRLLLL